MSTIRFKEENDTFYTTLSERVEGYLEKSNTKRYANGLFYSKALLLIGSYVACYALLLLSSNHLIAFWSMIALGPLAILIGINVGHDAAHGTISRYSWVNKAFLYSFDVLGANSYIWKSRHVHSHHSHPNILDHDADMKQNMFVRIFPQSELLKIHRFQFLYAPFLYLLYTLNWLHYRDYSDFFKSKIGSLQIKHHGINEILKLLAFKMLYISYILFIPLLFSVLTWQEILIAFLLMNFTASILITLALIPSHVAEHSEFPLPNKDGILPYSWSHHQVATVTDFATNNLFLNFLFGGFNHHVAHHLFPNINHIHSTKITPIIVQTIEDFGLKYNYENSFVNAYASHFRLLKNNGKPELKAS